MLVFFSFKRKSLALDAGSAVGFGHREKQNQGAALCCVAGKAEVKENPSAGAYTWRLCLNPFPCQHTEAPLLMAMPACVRMRSSLCTDVPMLKGSGGRDAASLPSQEVFSSGQGTASPWHLAHLLWGPTVLELWGRNALGCAEAEVPRVLQIVHQQLRVGHTLVLSDSEWDGLHLLSLLSGPVASLCWVPAAGGC